jgi:hypothetical protein
LPESFKKLTGYTDFETDGILFNMKDDPEQRVNLYEMYPEKVKELSGGLKAIVKTELDGTTIK